MKKAIYANKYLNLILFMCLNVWREYLRTLFIPDLLSCLSVALTTVSYDTLAHNVVMTLQFSDTQTALKH